MKNTKVNIPIKTKGIADEVDRYVGNRLRMRRSLLGFSQEKLAEFVGVTFQQIQKYERGSNRLSASRLLSFSQLLDVPVDYFFDGIQGKQKNPGFGEDDQEAFDTTDMPRGKDKGMMESKETLDLIKAYYSIDDVKKRKEILKIVKSMAKNLS